MRYSIIPDSDALSHCAGCGSRITEENEVFGVGAKFRPGVNLSDYEGHCIEITLLSREKPIAMMVTVTGSDAKRDGKDGMFLVCSEQCGVKLKELLRNEIAVGDIFQAVT
jgi:predicted nucleic acid-binding Zn ribbon protein